MMVNAGQFGWLVDAGGSGCNEGNAGPAILYTNQPLPPGGYSIICVTPRTKIYKGGAPSW